MDRTPGRLRTQSQIVLMRALDEAEKDGNANFEDNSDAWKDTTGPCCWAESLPTSPPIYVEKLFILLYNIYIIYII